MVLSRSVIYKPVIVLAPNILHSCQLLQNILHGCLQIHLSIKAALYKVAATICMEVYLYALYPF